MYFIAHRGESADAPENTMSAFQLAWQRDCAGVECDIWMTRDNILVCHHDKPLTRMTGCDQDVTNISYNELQTLDAGSWKDSTWKNERIPTLQQLLESTPPGKKLFIEIKDSERIIPNFMSCINQSGIALDQICVISFHETVIAACKKACPAIKACLLLSIKSEHKNDSTIFSPSADMLIKKLRTLRADGIDANANCEFTKDYIAAIQSAGFEFHVWTIDEPAQAKQFITLGVDSITSNKASHLESLLSS